jgi:hypothetical protein
MATQLYVGPIRRVKSGKGHRYEDANGKRVPGVTTMKRGIPSGKGLETWERRVIADYAIDHWDELAALPFSERHRKLMGAKFELMDKAANRGREVHRIADKLMLGEEVEVPEELAGHVESLIHFIDSYGAVAVLTEFVVFSHRHGYGGTGDAILDFPNGLPEPHPWTSRILPAPGLRILVDYKTSRSGIYGETALQANGYRYADSYLDADGNEQPMIEVDGVAGVHITADDFDLIPLESNPDMLRTLLYAKETHAFSESARDFVGDAIRHPSRVQRRRLEVAS